ncbi:hypothetical protein [Anaerosporobacter faecicola]|uniref:hypothetical protein n=1 Tax=Anaerosporobacter faecicola TaxID=2718714 RepID=UPI0014392171|nr:hypothetical protein [Anaerosporobacter faecicola]
MNICQVLNTNCKLKNTTPHILYQKESTHVAYQAHHRYILHHQVIYDTDPTDGQLKRITGKLYFINEMGEHIPCSYIPITIMTTPSVSPQVAHTNKHGHYTFTYQIDYKDSSLITWVQHTNNMKIYQYLPTLRIHFPLDTVIDDQDHILSERPYCNT